MYFYEWAYFMSQKIKFCKMHGLGNDFVVIDAINQIISLKKIPIRILANRHLGIGFDQLLVIKKSHIADFACRIFNADGSEAEQCGNGMRCIARFVHEEKLIRKKSFSIATPCGRVHVKIQNYDAIQVNMGIPQPGLSTVISAKKWPGFRGNKQALTTLSMGNPHAILQVPSLKNFPVGKIGSYLATHSLFPNGINVGFMEILNRKHIRLRTFERGVGETLSCGSNACAAVVAGIIHSWLDHCVKVELCYGNLHIEWQGENKPVLMTGPATRVYMGNIR